MIQEGKTLLADGFEKALIGVTDDGVAVYIKEAMIAALIDEGMTYEDSVEFLEFNVFSAYVGDYTPIYVNSVNLEDQDYDQC